MRFYRGVNFVLAFLLLQAWVFTATGKDPVVTRFPTPPQNENSLFYLQRSKNTNTIVYEVNIKSDGTLNTEQPLKVYWLRYAVDSTAEPLTYIQEKFAYGVKAKLHPSKPGQYIVTFNAYEKKLIYLVKKPDGKHYGAYTLINGRYAEMKRIFLKINGGTFWFPNIEYVEILGDDMATHKSISEQFKPAQ